MPQLNLSLIKMELYGLLCAILLVDALAFNESKFTDIFSRSQVILSR